MNVVVPKPSVETFRNSFMSQGFISWNSLPPHIKIVTILDSFERMYKKKYFYAPTQCYCTTVPQSYNSLAELCFISGINMFK